MTTAQAGQAAPAPLLACRGLSKSYGGIAALSSADLDLMSGTIHGIIGPNGAGKSTLVKLLAGVIKRDEGVILLNGEEMNFQDPAAAQNHQIVLMPQEIELLQRSSIVDNVTLGAESRRYGLRSGRACAERAKRSLDAVGLEVGVRLSADQLSKAQQRILMIARALNREARVLILDEPTAGLPPREAALVMAAVRRVAAVEQATVVYVSHHLSEVADLCDRVTCVTNGRIVATVEGDDVRRDGLIRLVLGAAGAGGAPTHGQRPEPVNASSTDWSLELRDVVGKQLAGASLVARRGEVLGLTGLMGSGVAELVDMIVGVTWPTKGTITIDGAEVGYRSPAGALAHGIGYLAADRSEAAFRGMSIRENVTISALGRWFGRLGIIRPTRERKQARAHLLSVSVHGDSERPLALLSGGNQQRALLARLIAADTRILVFNEPSVGVDVAARAEVWALMRSLIADRVLVVASSEPEELVALCDRVVCIKHGVVAVVLEGAQVTEEAIAHAIS